MPPSSSFLLTIACTLVVLGYRHCYKIQLGINFMGQIVLWTGPHNGCESDQTIWRSTWRHPHSHTRYPRCQDAGPGDQGTEIIL